MTSKVSICNTAITYLGLRPIDSLTSGRKEAIACNREFDGCVRSLLVIHPWNFAIKRAAAALADDVYRYGYTYRYTLPADCLRVLYTNDKDYVEFVVEGRQLLSNFDLEWIKYIYDNKDISTYPAYFVKLLSMYLAWTISYEMLQSPSYTRSLNESYNLYKTEAFSLDGQEGTMVHTVGEELLLARYGLTDTSPLGVGGWATHLRDK